MIANPFHFLRVVPLLFTVLVATSAMHAQRVDTIHANPNAVTLRVLWEKFGANEEHLGAAYGPLGDIFHMGSSAWLVQSTGPRECQIFVYDTATKTVQRRQTISERGGSFTTALNPVPIVGDFFGNDSLLVMIDERQTIHHFLSVRDSLLDTVPRFVLNASILDGKAIDLDRDSIDELLLIIGTSQGSFLWIYRGGPTFDVAAPTISIKLQDVGGYLLVADVNTDRWLDIMEIGTNLEVFLVDSTLWSWTSDHPPNNIRRTPATSPGMSLTDCDGDSIPDIAFAAGPDRIWLFRSRTGKSWATRTFDSTDVDNIYNRPNFAEPLNIGPISDSTRRYGALALISGGSHLIFSGGINGPDANWDAVGGGSLWAKPALDCDGDGWSDYMTGDGQGSGGFVRIYAGGPEIPRDPTVGVRWTPITGERHTQAVAVWPNPARDFVHIAWRGDLRRSPREFRVHDASGTLVASGNVALGSAEAVWDCSSRVDGRYTLSILDENGFLLATTPVLIQR